MRKLFALLVVLSGIGCGDNLTLPPERDPAKGEDPPELSCLPNLDGTIASTELSAAIGVPVRYVISPVGVSRSVDLVGKDEGEGTVWDFAIDFADDQALTVTPRGLEGSWFAASFPADAFVTPFDRDGRVLSIGQARADGIVLLGLASAEADPQEGRTLLVYDQPVTVLALPAAVGQSYVSVGNVTGGTAFGLPYAGRDTYEVSVDAIGELDLPQLTFEQVLRVKTKVTVEPAVGAAVVRRQVSFYAEFFGEVLRAQSQDGEPEELFTTATELLRLGF